MDEINRNGGILGRRVTLLEYDNQSTAEGSAEAARKAIDDGAVAVVGCNWSSHSLAMAEVLQRAGVPMITHMSTNEAVTKVGNYIFRACFTDSFQGVAMASFAFDRLECRTAAVLMDGDRAYSRGLGGAFSDAFEKLGGRVVLTVTYSVSGGVDYDRLVREVGQSRSGRVVRSRRIQGRCRHFRPGAGGRLRGLPAQRRRRRHQDVRPHRQQGGRHILFLPLEPVGGHVQVQGFRLPLRGRLWLRPSKTPTPWFTTASGSWRTPVERAGTTDGPKVRDALASTTDYEGGDRHHPFRCKRRSHQAHGHQPAQVRRYALRGADIPVAGC